MKPSDAAHINFQYAGRLGSVGEEQDPLFDVIGESTGSGNTSRIEMFTEQLFALFTVMTSSTGF